MTLLDILVKVVEGVKRRTKGVKVVIKGVGVEDQNQGVKIF